MSMQNPIADMLTRVRNAQSAKMAEVEMPSSKIKVTICDVLKSEGYIADFRVSEDERPSLFIKLRYYQGKPVIEYLQQVSKPSIRVYKSSTDMPRVKGGLGTAVVSTSKGLMTAKEARAQNVGGEIMLEVW